MKFGELREGQMFKMNNRLYLKTVNIPHRMGGHYDNAVIVNCGVPDFFRSYVDVELADEWSDLSPPPDREIAINQNKAVVMSVETAEMLASGDASIASGYIMLKEEEDEG